MALKEKTYNDDGTFTIRDFTPEELEQQAKDVAEAQAKQAAITQEATAKAALLKRLGLTADEAALLLS
jgi:hypothetical protein